MHFVKSIMGSIANLLDFKLTYLLELRVLMYSRNTLERWQEPLYGLHDQKVLDIGGITVGEIPGQNPTVLIGLIFYHGHKLVADDKQGQFDRTKAEAVINLQVTLSGIRRTGL